MHWWRKKQIMVDHRSGADAELLVNDIMMDEVVMALEQGTEVRKRGKGTEER